MESILIILFAGMLGMLHAFDADHVMAVSNLMCKESENKSKDWSNTIGQTLKWGIGHGGILSIIGIVFIWFGVGMEEAWVQSAEMFAGVLLCVLGIATLFSLRQKSLTLHTHSHKGLTHTHWVSKSKLNSHVNHTPVLVGMVHGMAGSASIVAILPSLMQTSLAFASIYLIVFSLGCLIGMLGFGFFWNKFFNKLVFKYQLLQKIVRGTFGSASCLLGVYWIHMSQI